MHAGEVIVVAVLVVMHKDHRCPNRCDSSSAPPKVNTSCPLPTVHNRVNANRQSTKEKEERKEKGFCLRSC